MPFERLRLAEAMFPLQPVRIWMAFGRSANEASKGCGGSVVDASLPPPSAYGLWRGLRLWSNLSQVLHHPAVIADQGLVLVVLDLVGTACVLSVARCD